ncbi:two component response regulator with GGDEF domain [Legionella busanensis]|uniref:diguanylate cyclase n=1 Tax=Legionella busanensis TaxID=190655 RepID=A0A378K9Y0_9GAMM|nr:MULTISPECIES: GGDEF domain-containing protein [Legionella]STX81516.1 two component response regulator with GGDEF domain [Legionella busanensis]
MKKGIFELQDECFLLLLQSSLKSIPFNIFLSTFIWSYLLYRQAPVIEVTLWYGLICFLSLTRWFYSQQSIHKHAYLLKKDRIKFTFILLTGFMGALWGICYIWFYPYFLAMHQNVITLALGGMASGALASLSIYLPAYYAYLIPMFLPLILYNYWLGDLDHTILASMFLLFVIMLIITAKFPSTLLKETIELTKEKDKALEEVQRTAITDGLTGLYNRRYFDQRFNEEFRRAQRNNHPLNLILIDVDDFKKINDQHGHPTGDLCLKELANTIKDSAGRANDATFRIGGDEFAAILSNISLEETISLCNKIQQKFKQDVKLAKPTISIGIVSIPPVCTNEIDEVVSVADQTLYKAKKAGKNQIYSQQLNC